jgi:predicted regulator of Ras-like GTPase activity (Roadblock/LC7/MglB family)
MKPRGGNHRRSVTAGASHEERDQQETGFTSILTTLVARLPGVRAAAMVDGDGETVDYAGLGDPFGVRVTAAHWRIVLEQASLQKELQSLRWLSVRGARDSYLVYALSHGYALVLTFTRAPGLVRWQRAVATCARALGQEAGWAPVQSTEFLPVPPAAWKALRRHLRGAEWFPVEIVADERRRPRSVRIGDRLLALEILGTIVSHRERREGPSAHPIAAKSARSERAWRVRLEQGVEATLVREAGGAWYTDEPVDLLLRGE